MEDWVDLSPARTAYRMRAVRREVKPCAQRRLCDACGELRACSKLNILAPEEGALWFCLANCWPYQLGVEHGQQRAAKHITGLVDRAFHPLST